MSSTPSIIGHWKSVADSMPDDAITCLVWSETFGDAMLAYHDSELLARRLARLKREASGWIGEGGRTIPGVTHYCDDILAPHDPEPEPAVLTCPMCHDAEPERLTCPECLGAGTV